MLPPVRVHALTAQVVRCTEFIGICIGFKEASYNRAVRQAYSLIQWRLCGFPVLSMSDVGLKFPLWHMQPKAHAKNRS